MSPVAGSRVTINLRSRSISELVGTSTVQISPRKPRGAQRVGSIRPKLGIHERALQQWIREKFSTQTSGPFTEGHELASPFAGSVWKTERCGENESSFISRSSPGDLSVNTPRDDPPKESLCLKRPDRWSPEPIAVTPPLAPEMLAKFVE